MVPNASLLGHLSGILTGIVSIQFLSVFRLASLPFNLVVSAPGTTFLASVLVGLQFDLLPKVSKAYTIKLNPTYLDFFSFVIKGY